MSNLNNILSHSACLSQQQLLQYLNNTLEQEEMRIVEEHFSDCMFCSDAFDGLAALSVDERSSLLAAIKDSTQLKIDQHIQSIEEDKEKKLILTQGGKSKKSWMAAAGILLLLFGGGAALFSYFNDHHKQEIQLAKNEKSAPRSNEKATLKEGSRELTTIRLSEDEMELDNNEVVAKNDKKESRKSNVPIEENKYKALPSSAPVQNNNRDRLAINETKDIGDDNSIEQEELNSTAPIKEKRADVVAKTEEQQLASDFSTMNTATKPRYEGKLKSTPQSTNVDLKSISNDKTIERKKSDRSQAEVAQQGQSSYGKKAEVLSTYEQGFALYQAGDYKKSIRLFKKALRQKNVKNAEDIKYYLALALQKEGKEQEADDLLAELEKGTRYKESARKARRVMK